MSYYRGSKGVVVAYDVSDRSTFESVEEWVNEANTYCKSKFELFIVGNKTDLERAIERDEGEELAKEMGGQYFEISCKTGDGVEDMFLEIAEITAENL